jgi:hypothetical protein
MGRWHPPAPRCAQDTSRYRRRTPAPGVESPQRRSLVGALPSTPSPLGRLIRHSGAEVIEREQQGIGGRGGRLNAGREATLRKQHELGIRRDMW